MALVFHQLHRDAVACLEDIPIGARFFVNEIAAKLSADIASGLVACGTIIGQSLRFGQFHVQTAAIGAKALRLSKEKGWLIPPPLHHFKKKIVKSTMHELSLLML